MCMADLKTDKTQTVGPKTNPDFPGWLLEMTIGGNTEDGTNSGPD